MHLEIVSVPFHVMLSGYRGVRAGESVYDSARPLMDRMWGEVRDRRIKTKGINHWVYLPDRVLFTGIELQEPSMDVGTLDRLDVSLDRYVRYMHVGPYSALPRVWQEVKATIERSGEKPQYPNLEIYGHWNADETKCETTILIGLAP